MRLTPLFVLAAAIGLTVSTASMAQRDDQIDPRSVAMIDLGLAQQQAGNLAGAIDFYESALAVDPRNRSAYVALAQIARAQGLPGKAISLYREALAIDPSDLNAVAGEGEALAQKGAINLARERLETALKLCGDGCTRLAGLEQAIAAGEAKQRTALAVEAVTPQPQVTQEPPAGVN